MAAEIHGIDQRLNLYTNTLQTDPQISTANEEAAHRFLQELQVEGLAKNTVQKYLSTLITILRLTPRLLSPSSVLDWCGWSRWTVTGRVWL